jgi:hypothetical protein
MRTVVRLAFALVVLTLVTWSTMSPVAAEPENQLLPNATVSSVSATSFVVMANGQNTIFAVDAKTKVIRKDGARAMLLPPARRRTFEDMLKVGDHVTVTYHHMDAKKLASKIEVTPARATR